MSSFAFPGPRLRLPSRLNGPFLAASTITVLAIGLHPRRPLTILATVLAAAAVGVWATRPRWLSPRARHCAVAVGIWLGYAAMMTSALALVIGRGTIASNAYILPLVLASLIVTVCSLRARLAHAAATTFMALSAMTAAATATAIAGATDLAVLSGLTIGLLAVWMLDGGWSRLRNRRATARPSDLSPAARLLQQMLRRGRRSDLCATLRDEHGPCAHLLAGRGGLILVPLAAVKVANRAQSLPTQLAAAVRLAGTVSKTTRLPVLVACPASGSQLRQATAQVTEPGTVSRWRRRSPAPLTVAMLTGPSERLAATAAERYPSLSRHAARGAIARCRASKLTA